MEKRDLIIHQPPASCPKCGINESVRRGLVWSGPVYSSFLCKHRWTCNECGFMLYTNTNDYREYPPSMDPREANDPFHFEERFRERR